MAPKDDTLPLLQGTLDILILKSLARGTQHGYAVARWIRDTTDDALQIEDGALYTALHRMEKRGWVRSDWGVSENNRKAKFYGLTHPGEKQLQKGSRAWARYAEAVAKVLDLSGIEGTRATPASKLDPPLGPEAVR